jgi:hypothetical protein
MTEGSEYVTTDVGRIDRILCVAIWNLMSTLDWLVASSPTPWSTLTPCDPILYCEWSLLCLIVFSGPHSGSVWYFEPTFLLFSCYIYVDWFRFGVDVMSHVCIYSCICREIHESNFWLGLRNLPYSFVCDLNVLPEFVVLPLHRMWFSG